MIKVIAFDYGGVLGCEANDWNHTFKKVLDTSGLTYEEMNKIWEKHWPKLRIGKEEIDEYWLNAAHKNNLVPQNLRQLYNNSITINNDVLNLAKSLKEKYKVVILSNDTIDWMDAKIKRFNLKQTFAKVYCSGNLRMAKPDKKIYEYVLQDLNIKPEELLFIDNLEDNTKAAESLGIHSILFTDYAHTISHIKNSYKDIIRNIN